LKILKVSKISRSLERAKRLQLSI